MHMGDAALMEVDVKPAAISLSYPPGPSRRPNRQAVSPRRSVDCKVITWRGKRNEGWSLVLSCCSLIALFVLKVGGGALSRVIMYTQYAK